MRRQRDGKRREMEQRGAEQHRAGRHPVGWKRLRGNFSWACAVVGALVLPATAMAVGPESPPDTDAMFSLQRARRAQEREATVAAPYRSNLPWPVGAADADRTRWLVATAGADFDEQPVLLSNGLGPPDERAQNSHAAGLWFVDAGSELFDSGPFAGGLAASYWGQAWSDWDEDTHYPALATWLDWKIGETWALRARYDLGYAAVDNEGFATTHYVGPGIFKDWRDAGVTEVFAQYYYYDFHTTDGDPSFGPVGAEPGDLCRPAIDPLATACAPNHGKTQGSRRDRTGWGFLFGGEHRVDLDWNATEIRAGYLYQHYIPDGAEFHNQSHELWMQVTTALPCDFVLETNLAFLYQGARNVPSFPDLDTLEQNTVYDLPGYRRHDTIWRWYTAIGREITPNVSAALEYAFMDHDSNLDTWDYARHRIGGTLTVHFD
jgi:hypothetical protein